MSRNINPDQLNQYLDNLSNNSLPNWRKDCVLAFNEDKILIRFSKEIKIDKF